MKTICPEGWTTAGHYAPGVVSRGLLYISGQLPVDHKTGALVSGGAAAQAEAALRNVEQVLLAAGAARSAVVQCRVYVSDIAQWGEVDAVYAAFFGAHRPARAVVPAGELHYGALVEIEAVAEMEDVK